MKCRIVLTFYLLLECRMELLPWFKSNWGYLLLFETGSIIFFTKCGFRILDEN
jgi:hypothetical protein